MRKFKHWAHLNPEGRKLFGFIYPSGRVPVLSMVPMYGPLGSPDNPPQRYFKIQWDELDQEQQQKTIEWLTERFGCSESELLTYIEKVGLPLRASLTNSSGTNHPGLFFGGIL